MTWVGCLTELRYCGSRTKVGETVSSMTYILIFVNILTITVSRAQLFERRLALTRVSFHQKHSIEWFSLLFLEYPIVKLWAKRIKLNLIFKLSYLSSNFALTLGYLNPASNNPAQVPKVTNITFLLTISIHNHEKGLWEIIKLSPKRKCFDLLPNSFNLFSMGRICRHVEMRAP